MTVALFNTHCLFIALNLLPLVTASMATCPLEFINPQQINDLNDKNQPQNVF